MPVVSGIIRTQRTRDAWRSAARTTGEIEHKLKAAIDQPIPPQAREISPTREVTLIGDDVDLYRLPIPMSSIYDGGPMITAGVVIARDPELGVNSGIYRFIVKEKNLTGIDIVTPNNMRLFARRAYERGEPLPISISIGTHPIEITGSGYRAPLGVDEMAIAGGLRGAPVELAPCATIDLPYIADAEIVLEAEILPTGWTWPEGRFGEFTRLMGGLHWNPLVRVKAIAMRKDAIYYNLHMPWENTWLAAPTRYAAIRQALKTAGVAGEGHQCHARRLRLLARGDLDQEAAGRRQERAPRRALGDGPQACRGGRRRYRRVRSDRRRMGDRDPRPGRPRRDDRHQCAGKAARSEPAAGFWRGADRRQGRHRRHHPGRHPEGALRAHHLRLCGAARRIGDYVKGKADPPGEAGDERAVAALAEKILAAIDARSRFTTPTSPSGSRPYDFRTVAQALGHLHATRKALAGPARPHVRARLAIRRQAAGKVADYSALMWAALTIGHHFSISAFCSAPSASGDLLVARRNIEAERRHALPARPRSASGVDGRSVELAMMSRGVPFGTHNPYQTEM